MRVIYFGSGTFSVPSFQAVLDGPHEVVGVYTQPARPAGRKGAPRPTPIAAAASERGVEVVECPNINAPEVVEHIRELAPDVICVVDFGQLIKQPVLDAPRLGAFNLHGSLLPALRGAAPIQWALIRGLEVTGVTTFRIVLAMDAGPIYLQKAVEIDPEETADELKARLAELGAGCVRETLDRLASGEAVAVEQDHEKATPAPRLKKADGRIDFAAGAKTVHDLVRGCWPWPGGQATLCRQSAKPVAVTIARSRVLDGEASCEPGVLDGDLAVACGTGRLAIERILPAGKRLMDWVDFINGYRLQPGDRFIQP